MWWSSPSTLRHRPRMSRTGFWASSRPHLPARPKTRASSYFLVTHSASAFDNSREAAAGGPSAPARNTADRESASPEIRRRVLIRHLRTASSLRVVCDRKRDDLNDIELG